MIQRTAFALATLCALGAAAAFTIPEPSISGPARVIDGDTIVISGTHIRLFGIDAPESKQECEANGLPWKCGEVATSKLRELIGASAITCTPKDKDRYDRTVAECSLYGRERTLNELMVFLGYAIAYRKYGGEKYEAAEREAKSWKVGLWQGTFTYPWVWRQQHKKNGGDAQTR